MHLRDSAYRVGAGDSGNRMLMHVLFILLAYLVLAVAFPRVRRRPARQEATARSAPEEVEESAIRP
jgi:hypothetical protein